MSQSNDIRLQIDELTATLPGASAALRAVIEAQIRALQATDANTLNANDIDTGGGDVVVGQKIVIHQTLADEADAAGLSAQALTLYRLLSDRWFDTNDLEDIAFQLDIDWDSLPGAAKPGKARALVRHCEKHGLIAKLKGLMRLARPNLREQLT